MSDSITVINQLPTPCDFGPFARGACGKKINLTIILDESHIETQPINWQAQEEIPETIDLNDYIVSGKQLDFSTLVISAPSEGTITKSGSIITFTADKLNNTNRTVQVTYTVSDILGTSSTNTITFHVTDTTKILTSTPITLSGTEGVNYTIPISTYVTAKNTTLDLSTLTTSTPSEGTITIAAGVITYKPNTASAVTRTVTFTYTIKDTSGIVTTTNNVSITLSDVTPTLTATSFSVVVAKDTAPVATTITSKITLKNDTFKSVTCATPTEGTISISGAVITFTPNATIATNRSATVVYTVTSNSGLTATGTITYTITDDNLWNDTIWYGNSLLTSMTEAGITALENTVRQADFPGQYIVGAATQTYKWICYPASWGEPLAVMDPTTQMDIAVNTYQTLMVNGINMLCIRTFYKTSSALTFKLV